MTNDTPQFIRNDAVLLSYEAKRALNIIAKAMGLSCTEELAQRIVEGWITSNHPEVWQHIRTQQENDEAFKKLFKSKINPAPME